MDQNTDYDFSKYDSSLNVFSAGDQATRAKIIAKLCEGSVLSVGEGDGYIASLIQQNDEVSSIIATDIADHRCKHITETYGIATEVCSACALPFPDDFFDTVVCSEVLEHIVHMGEAWKEIFRVARKQVIVSFPVAPPWEPDETHRWRVRAYGCVHHNGQLAPLHNYNVSMMVIQFKKWVHINRA